MLTNKKVFISFAFDSNYCQLVAAYADESAKHGFRVIATTSYTVKGFSGSEIYNQTLAVTSINEVYYKFINTLKLSDIEIQGICLTISSFQAELKKVEIQLRSVFKSLADKNGTEFHDDNFIIYERGTSVASFLTNEKQHKKGLILSLEGTRTTICYYDWDSCKTYSHAIKHGYINLISALQKEHGYASKDIWNYLKGASCVVKEKQPTIRRKIGSSLIPDTLINSQSSNYLQCLFQRVRSELREMETYYKIKIDYSQGIILTGIGSKIGSIDRCVQMVFDSKDDPEITRYDLFSIDFENNKKNFKYYDREESYILPVSIKDFILDWDSSYLKNPEIVNNDVLIHQSLTGNLGALKMMINSYQQKNQHKKGVKGIWLKIRNYFKF